MLQNVYLKVHVCFKHSKKLDMRSRFFCALYININIWTGTSSSCWPNVLVGADPLDNHRDSRPYGIFFDSTSRI